jgi:hypothetical protein
VGWLADRCLDRRRIRVVWCHSDRGRWRLLPSGSVRCVNRVFGRWRLLAITSARRRAVGLLRRVFGCRRLIAVTRGRRRLFTVPCSRRRLLAMVGARRRAVGLLRLGRVGRLFRVVGRRRLLTVTSA